MLAGSSGLGTAIQSAGISVVTFRVLEAAAEDRCKGAGRPRAVALILCAWILVVAV